MFAAFQFPLIWQVMSGTRTSDGRASRGRVERDCRISRTLSTRPNLKSEEKVEYDTIAWSESLRLLRIAGPIRIAFLVCQAETVGSEAHEFASLAQTMISSIVTSSCLSNYFVWKTKFRILLVFGSWPFRR